MTKVLMDLPDLPEKYEYTGEYRCPKVGEYYMHTPSDICKCSDITGNLFLIIRIKRWRAGEGEKYFFISDLMDVRSTDDVRGNQDNTRYSAGNYFKTVGLAHEALGKILEIFNK